MGLIQFMVIVGFAVFVFSLWTGIGYLFQEVKTGMWAGVFWAAFYTIRFILEWNKDE